MKKRILVVLPCITQANGVSSYALNYYEKMNCDLIHMDFLVMKKSDLNCYKNKIKNESKIFELIKGDESIKSYLNRIDDFFRINALNYDIVHCHVYNSGAFVLYAAKKYGIPIRILHSHATKSSDVFLHRVINSFLIPISKFFSTDYFACSNLAGNFLFKNKKFTIINNAINFKKYVFDINSRNLIRKELKLENCFVIGNVGRLCNQKNQILLLKIFKEVFKEISNARLIIIGNGKLEKKLKKYAEKNGIDDSVLFLGMRKDVEKIYNAMDVFCLTSLYEGLPVVGIEAQVNGLPCVFSSSITAEVKQVSNVEFVNLKDNVKVWKNKILKYKDIERTGCINLNNIKKYDIDEECFNLEKKYIDLIEKRKE